MGSNDDIFHIRYCLGKDKIIWNTQDREITTAISEPYIRNKSKSLTCYE